MFGVCGVLNFDGKEVSPFLLKKIIDPITHRGPDGEGWYRNLWEWKVSLFIKRKGAAYWCTIRHKMS